MTLPPQRLLVALAIAGAVGGTAYWQMGGTSSDGAAPVRATPRGTASTRGSAGAAMPVVTLNLDRLKRDPDEELDAPDRDPFRFRQAAPPPPPPRPVEPPKEMTVVLPPPPPGPPPPPPIALKYIGLVDAPTQSGRVAVLSDTRGSVFYGKEGDIIDGRYRVLRINPESAELAYVDGRGRQVIRLSGQ